MKVRFILFIPLVGLLQLITSCSHKYACVQLNLLWGSDRKKHDTLVIFLPWVRDKKKVVPTYFNNRFFVVSSTLPVTVNPLSS